MKNLAFSIEGTPILAPSGIPTTGLSGSGQKIITLAIDLLLLSVVLLALFFLIFGGIQWITSEGDKTKLQNARNRIMYSIIGLIVALTSFFIINLIAGFFGVPLT